jgi:hypothetical protein
MCGYFSKLEKLPGRLTICFIGSFEGSFCDTQADVNGEGIPLESLSSASFALLASLGVVLVVCFFLAVLISGVWLVYFLFFPPLSSNDCDARIYVVIIR